MIEFLNLFFFFLQEFSPGVLILPGRTWIQIALPQFCLRLLDALAKVLLDDPTFLFVAERFRRLRAATTSGSAQ